MPRRYAPSVHYFRKHIPAAEGPVGGFSVKRRVETEHGFLGAQAVKDVLGNKEGSVYTQPDTGFTIITRTRADRLAATFPGTQTQFDDALEATFRKLPARRVTNIRRVESIAPSEGVSEYVVAAVLHQSIRSMRRYERHYLYTELDAPWMVTGDRAGSLRVPVYTASSGSEAEHTASALNKVVALGDTALVLGELYVSRRPAQLEH